jgi:transposase
MILKHSGDFMPRLSEQQRADILRLHLVEHWPVGTIATQLGLHHSTVERVISQAGMPKVERAKGPSIIDPYLPFIHDTLAQYPTLTASRIYQMACERGYPGGPSHFRQWIAQLRPRKAPEAYLRLQTLPGEQAQMDWGHFGYLQVGRAKRPLMAFVMVLSYSRQIFLRFYHDAQMASFLHGHIQAFEALGVPRVVLYDNLKSAVQKRYGRQVEFNPRLYDLSGHYGFEPRPVAIARGNEKGRVERAIRYIRDNFFAARHIADLESLNDQAAHWCTQIASRRACPQNPDLTIEEAFIRERSELHSMPDNPFDCDDTIVVSIGKTPYARYDLNDYSVPHECVRRDLTIRASQTQVRIMEADQLLAVHPRSYDKGQVIEHTRHIEALKQAKRKAANHSTQYRLVQQVPSAEAFLQHNQNRGHRLGRSVRKLEQWLDQYGTQPLEQALKGALEQRCYHTSGVLQLLEQQREHKQLPIPLTGTLPDKAHEQTLFTPTTLQSYESLHQAPENDTDMAITETTHSTDSSHHLTETPS